MDIHVHLPSILHSLTNEQPSLKIALPEQASTVAGLIRQMDTQHPGLQARLLDGNKVLRFINIYVNDSDIRFAQQLATPLKAGDEVVILSAVAGGNPNWQGSDGWQYLLHGAA